MKELFHRGKSDFAYGGYSHDFDKAYNWSLFILESRQLMAGCLVQWHATRIKNLEFLNSFEIYKEKFAGAEV